MSGWKKQWYGKDPGVEKEIAMDVPLGPTDPVFQVPGGSAVAEWTAEVVLVQVTVDPTVVLMDGGLKQNPDGVPQDEFWVIDTELAAARAGSGSRSAGLTITSPRNASGTSLRMILTPNCGSKGPYAGWLRLQVFDLIPNGWPPRSPGGRVRVCAPRREEAGRGVSTGSSPSQESERPTRPRA
jgi:hypothetical protein